ncbi:hypothetical protein [Novosphingobium sp.]|uniref:hypothetical protein n=1 Tax=Novosphingobium sp. TaxID=1874826 RepID=UPI00261BBCAD|nr:hypothetical protein [Novosphingobium sp.]
MAATTLHTEASASNCTPSAADLLALRMNGTIPFLTHGDGLDDALKQARAMIIVLESAFRTASDADHLPEVDTINCLNPSIVADALEGTATLIALAQYHRAQKGA